MSSISIPVRSTETTQGRKLGLGSLAALVVGSMIGGGVFSLPQNMAKGASPGAVLLGWVISGFGILALALVYQSLATRKPKLDAGPYAYARDGFGDFIGFNSAWGYWLSAWIGNVSYAVLIFGALSYFFPAFGAEGNTVYAVIGASIVLWVIHALILAGVKQAAIVNVVTTIAKLVPIAIFILFVALAFNAPKMNLDFWGVQTPSLGTLLTQIQSTMLVTLWVFIGIEGASVESGRAERRQDIGRATMLGFIVALVAYALVSMLAFGVMSQAELGALPTAASMANVMEKAVGPWGSVLVRIGIVVSVLGAFLAWTLIAAEIPYRAAKEGMMPALFATENKSGSPSGALWVTNICVQLGLLLTLYANSTYLALFYIASVAILVPYVLSGAYAVKLALSGETYEELPGRNRDMMIGLVATLFGIWLLYAAGPNYLLMCALLYAPGLAVYWRARRGEAKAFGVIDVLIAMGILLAAAAAAYLMWIGKISAL